MRASWRGRRSHAHPDVRLVLVAFCLALAGAGCQSAAQSPTSSAQTSPRAAERLATGSPASTAAQGPGCKVGVAWSKSTDERTSRWYEPAVKGAIEAGGGQYVAKDASGRADIQSQQVQELVDAGVDVLIVLPQSPALVKPATQKAVASGIPVVALDRAIIDPGILFVGTDQVMAGALQASALLQYKASGRFIVIKGDSSDLESSLLRQGMTQTGLPDVGQQSSRLVNAGETFTPGWDPNLAEQETEKLLAQNQNNVDLILVESDAMASGVYRALERLKVEVSLDSPVSMPKVLIAGRGGDPTALNRVAQRTQIVDMWENLPLVGRLAGQAALALCVSPLIDHVTTSAGKPRPFEVPDGPVLSAVLLNPVDIQQWNLDVVVDAQWVSADVVCQGVDPEMYVDVCRR